MKILTLISTLFLSLLLMRCASHPPRPNVTSNVRLYEFNSPSKIGTIVSGDSLYEGGFSGLQSLYRDQQGKLHFLTHSDRGPNGEIYLKNSMEHRPFLLPDFCPSFYEITADPTSQKFDVRSRTPLTKGQTCLTGLPAAKVLTEISSDINGVPLSPHSDGLDPEGISMTPDGTVWIAEEYGPSILAFDRNGQWMERFIPENGKALGLSGTEVLPKHYLHRKPNRGFEGITVIGNKLYTILQSPLDLPFKNIGPFVPILEFDLKTKKPSAEYLYRFEGSEADKLGDLASTPSGDLLVIEQNSKTQERAIHKIFKVKLHGATNLMLMKKPWATAKETELAQVRFVEKHLVLDLKQVGIDFLEKVEGLTVIDSKTLAIINDDDFGAGTLWSPITKKLNPQPATTKSQLAVITLENPL